MEYRKLPHGTEQIGVLGLGMGIIKDTNHSVYDTISYALAHKVNFFDLCCYYEDSFKGFKEASQEVKRDSFYVQMHLGAVYKNGEYAFSRNLSRIQDTFEGKLAETSLQYADFGFLHCIDEDKDLDLVLNKGIYDYALKLKSQGLIRHLALSTHTPHIALRALKEISLDLLMFSINPAFDYQKGTYAYGEINERQNLYQQAEALGVAISVMKPFAGRQLLSKENSPLGISLTIGQCISYALDKPAVVTVLPGASNLNELKTLLTYFEATDSDKDYSILGNATPKEAQGRCVYCNHCSPCPKGINVGLVNKYYDLALIGDEMAKSHYLELSHHASLCNDCKHCDKRCPFKVSQAQRMHEIATYFGK